MEEADYPFRYPIEEKKEEAESNPLTEMIRAQLESLLGLLTLFYKGEEVKVDGFRLMNENRVIHPIFPPFPHRLTGGSQGAGPTFQSIRSAELYEPRISHIKRLLESLLSVVELESGGNLVKVDALRLKNLTHWQVPSAGDPAEIFDHLATRCDCHCSFCYLRGNPPGLALEQPRREAEEEYEEVRTRLRYFSPRAKQALFPTLGSPYEILSHPRALDLLAELRRKTDRTFRLSTNGSALTEESIQKLNSLKPLYLYLSLNSSSPGRRRLIMGDNHPEIAIRSLPLLKQYRIPYAVIIVPWPVPSSPAMLEDLKETIAYADRHEAHLVEVSLPGCTRFFPGSPLFNPDDAWSAVVAGVRQLRESGPTPLLVKPSMYEENRYEVRKNLPRIVGLVRNSPAASSGLKIDDLILSINGLQVSSRPQVRDILRLHQQNQSQKVCLSVQRRGRVLEVEIFPEQGNYPYSPETDHHLGIIFLGSGFRASALEDLKGLIDSRGARRVLFLSSKLVRPVFEQFLRESPLFGNVQIQVEVPENRFFGGNIFMGDLLVVQDYIDAITEYLKKGPLSPDLIIIPSSPFALGDWRRDLTGRVYSDIERATGIPVALLDCEPIYD